MNVYGWPLVRLSTTQVRAPVVVQVLPSGSLVAVYPVMALPPGGAAAQVTDAEATAGVAVTPVGLPGTVGAVGVTLFDEADSGPDPLALAAWTVKAYSVPLVRPLTVQAVAPVAAHGTTPRFCSVSVTA